MKKVIDFNKVYDHLTQLFSGDVHLKRVLSISNGVLGVITSASLGVNLIGQGLAAARGGMTKHGVKQVDR